MRSAALIASLLVSASCTLIGDEAVRGSRTAYNVALQQSADEQLLLNLVRLRYRDQLLFLEASALTTQFKFRAAADATSEFGSQVTEAFGLDVGVAVEENPTVTYTPLQGADFVQRILTPVKIETLLLLDDSGWSLERLLRLLVEDMNGLDNASRASGPTPAVGPDVTDFRRAAALLRDFELAGSVSGGREDDHVVLVFDDEALASPLFAELADLLGLDPTLGRYRITSHVGTAPRSGDRINLLLRSPAGAMSLLAQGVDVPPGHIESGRVTDTRGAGGEPFDWGGVTSGLMQIHASSTPPVGAAVAVRHRGTWFSIDDADLPSKSTFALLGQVLALQSGDVERALPVLTLPIGG